MSNFLLESVVDTITRPANTTAYGAGDVAGYLASVTGATNASPIVITSTAHGLATDDYVEIASVGGNTSANGTWKITKIDADTFSLNDSTGNAAYTSGGTIASPYKFSPVARGSGDGYKGAVRSVRLEIEASSTTNADFTVLLVRPDQNTGLPPTMQGDNVAFAWDDFDAPLNMIGKVSFANASAKVISGYATWQTDDLFIPFELHPGAGTTHIFGILLADAAYTPSSAKKFRITLGVDKQ